MLNAFEVASGTPPSGLSRERVSVRDPVDAEVAEGGDTVCCALGQGARKGSRA